ncbi:innate immunity activator protein isoform X2 [Sorex araneus]|uniref:innate immunity activator protein isoform X2 n=1 Tax=Sorex araneus TaxID=42254 RepID=UPI00243338E4|nr:innate immunity activator protein isoform X2 [Sorex araneus]
MTCTGPDSPVSPMKELTQAVRKQQRALEERLEACLEELRRLCLREAELTGTLPAEYPLKPGEKAPKVRRRIGAAYKLDERALHREDPLSGLERELALQQQIAEAARRLCGEQSVGRQARRQRKQVALQEERKLQELQRRVGERRRNSAPAPAPAGFALGPELSTSDDSSLSDGLLLEEEEPQLPKPPPESPAPPPRPAPPQSLEGLQPAGPEPGALERAPIQSSPWKETSLDHPYEKPKKSSEPSSESSSPATTPQDGPSATDVWLLEPATYHVIPVRNGPGQRPSRTSAPATPEMLDRRGQPQSLRLESFLRAGAEGRGRSAFPRRRPTHYTVTVPESCFPQTKPPPPPACSEDSGSDVSSASHPTSPGSSSPDISILQPLSPSEPLCQPGAWGPAGGHTPKLLLPPGYLPAGRYVMVAAPEGHLLPPSEWELGRAAQAWAYEEATAAAGLRVRRLVPAPGRLGRAPSLKDTPAARLSKAVVSRELESWHERARLRSARPHSLDRQGAFRVRSLPPGRALGPRTQVPAVCVLRRSPDGAPVQVFVPENGEIISQV